MVAVVKGYRNICGSLRLTELCSGENDILHLRASKAFSTLFTENPSDSIGDITLAGTVRTDNTCDAMIKFKYYFIGK